MAIDQSSQAFTNWLTERGVRNECPACDGNDWIIRDDAPPATPDGGGTTLGGPSFPLILRVCKSCAYVMHFATPHLLSNDQLREHYLSTTSVPATS